MVWIISIMLQNKHPDVCVCVCVCVGFGGGGGFGWGCGCERDSVDGDMGVWV